MSQKQRTGDEVTMETTAVSRFALAFKHARLTKRWKQEDLAKALHIKLRTVVSWETGTRLPSAGIVFLLCMLFQDQGGAADLFQHDLFISYLLDDLQRQMQVHPDRAFSELVNQGVQRLLSVSSVADQPPPVWEREELPLPLEQAQRNEQNAVELSAQSEQGATLEHLFTLFEHLREHPELIAVVNDFLHEVAGTSSASKK